MFSFCDAFLLSFILGGLLSVSFVKQSTPGTDSLVRLYKEKKHFYILTRTALLVSVGHLFGTLSQLTTKIDTLTLDQNVKTLEMYGTFVTSEIGSLMFRNDFVSMLFVVVLNICVVLYLLLVLNYFSLTKPPIKYAGEIPILVITIFFSLKYFLLAYDFLMLIICLELASLCTLILLSLHLTSNEKNVFPIEAAIKYFLFNAVAVGLMLFAMTGYFIIMQTFNLLDFSLQLTLNPYFQVLNLENIAFLHFFFFFGYLMKLGAAPLHHWVPDVYEGVELIMTAFLILIVSPALNFKFFTLVKLLLPINENGHIIYLLFVIFGTLSIFVGVFSAISQFKLKRFLAYASITHLGFMLISLGLANYLGFFASFFYLITYIFTNLAFFGLLLLIHQHHLVTFIYLNQLKSLLPYNYFMFFFFVIPLFSFAGFPPFAGFFGKLFVFSALLDSTQIFLAISLVIYVVINGYLYLRFVKIALFEKRYLKLFVPMQFSTTSNNNTVITEYAFKKAPQFLPILRNKTLLFILFLINVLLGGILIFLPSLSLLCSHSIFNLFLFF